MRIRKTPTYGTCADCGQTIREHRLDIHKTKCQGGVHKGIKPPYPYPPEKRIIVGQPWKWMEEYKNGRLHVVCFALHGLTFACHLIRIKGVGDGGEGVINEVNRKQEVGTLEPHIGLTLLPVGTNYESTPTERILRDIEEADKISSRLGLGICLSGCPNPTGWKYMEAIANRLWHRAPYVWGVSPEEIPEKLEAEEKEQVNRWTSLKKHLQWDQGRQDHLNRTTNGMSNVFIEFVYKLGSGIMRETK